MVNYNKTLLEGLKFGFNPKRFLLLFIPDLILILSALVFFFNSNLAVLLFGDIWQLLLAFSPLIVIFIILQLVKLWMMASLIHQSWKPRELKQSFKIVKKRYLTFLSTAIILLIINFIAGMIQYVNIILTTIISIIFLFPYQAIIISEAGVISSLKQSCRIFRKNPWQVLLAWLFVTIISAIITIVFAIPLFAWLFPAIVSSAQQPTILIATVLSNIPLISVLGAIVFLGSAIGTTFQLKAVTGFYLQLKQK